jgi:hypothetical protein
MNTNQKASWQKLRERLIAISEKTWDLFVIAFDKRPSPAKIRKRQSEREERKKARLIKDATLKTKRNVAHSDDWSGNHSILADTPFGVGPLLQEDLMGTTSRPIITNVKQGAIIGGCACFGVGLFCMFLSPSVFFLYGPLFLVAFILSIVAMSQNRVVCGIMLLLATLIIPPVLGFVQFSIRSTKTSKPLKPSVILERPKSPDPKVSIKKDEIIIKNAQKIIPEKVDLITILRDEKIFLIGNGNIEIGDGLIKNVELGKSSAVISYTNRRDQPVIPKYNFFILNAYGSEISYFSDYFLNEPVIGIRPNAFR